MPRRAGTFPRFLCSLAVAGSLALAGGHARAQSPADIKAGRQAATDGLTAYNAGEYDKALALFTKAKQLYPSAQVLRMVGYTELALEHWLKALEALEGALDDKITPLAKEDRKDVEDNMAKAMAHIGTLSVTSKVPGAKVSIDGGDPRPLPLDKPIQLVEGWHKVLVTAPNRVDASGDVKVDPGKQADLPLDPAAKAAPPPVVVAPPPPPPPPERGELFPNQRTIGFATTGAGVAFGVAALVTVIESAHWRSMASSDAATHLTEYGSGCAKGDPRLCAYDISVTNHEADVADQLRNAAAGLGVTAAVLGAAGITFIVLTPKAKPADSASSPTQAGSQASPGPQQASARCGIAGGLGVVCSGAF